MSRKWRTVLFGPIEPRRADCSSEFVEQFKRGVPSDTGVGDALSIYERFASFDLLGTRNQIAFEHYAHYAPFPALNLADQFPANARLACIVPLTIRVAAINHHTRN